MDIYHPLDKFTIHIIVEINYYIICKKYTWLINWLKYKKDKIIIANNSQSIIQGDHWVLSCAEGL